MSDQNNGLLVGHWVVTMNGEVGYVASGGLGKIIVAINGAINNQREYWAHSLTKVDRKKVAHQLIVNAEGEQAGGDHE